MKNVIESLTYVSWIEGEFLKLNDCIYLKQKRNKRL